MNNPLKHIVDIEHVLTPIAVELLHSNNGLHQTREFKVLYIFGVRIAYWRVDA